MLFVISGYDIVHLCLFPIKITSYSYIYYTTTSKWAWCTWFLKVDFSMDMLWKQDSLQCFAVELRMQLSLAHPNHELPAFGRCFVRPICLITPKLNWKINIETRDLEDPWTTFCIFSYYVSAPHPLLLDYGEMGAEVPYFFIKTSCLTPSTAFPS